MSCLLWLIAEHTAVVQLLIEVLELAFEWDSVGNFGSFVPVMISARISISGCVASACSGLRFTGMVAGSLVPVSYDSPEKSSSFVRSIGDVCFGLGFDANAVTDGGGSDWYDGLVATGGDGLVGAGLVVFCWRMSRID